MPIIDDQKRATKATDSPEQHWHSTSKNDEENPTRKLGTESPEPVDPFKKFDDSYDMANEFKSKMAQQLGKFYATVV